MNRYNPDSFVIFPAILCICFFIPAAGTAQTLVPVGTGLPDLSYGSTCWGDYDADGDLDLLMTGRTAGGDQVSTIYRNDSGVFVDINAGLTGVYSGAAAWGDYDNDSDLDIILSGWDEASNIVTVVYRNDGSDTFTDIQAGIIGVSQSAVDWGDFDNDGDLDILLMGGADFPTLETMRIYRNDGNDTFTQTSTSLEGLRRGSVNWGDYDGDGDLDILATGNSGFSEASTLLYRNDGGETFTLIDPGLFNLFDGEGRWGDYDQDGDPDILVNGSDSTSTMIYTFVYRNDGTDIYTDIHATVEGAGEGGSLAPGDCDNDGDLDLAMSAAMTAGTVVYRYQSDSVFTNLDSGLNSGCCGALAWGDYDNDGDLDLITALFISGTIFYRNDVSPANTPPNPPTGLAAGVLDDKVTLSWLPAADAETESAGLTYNIRLGTTPGGGEIVSAMSDRTTGYRRIASFGNVFHNTSWTITNLSDGTYFWSVQAVDNNFAGSAFATERTFTVPAQVDSCCNSDGIRGDADNGCGFGCVTVSDVSYLVAYLFHDGPVPLCETEADADNDCEFGCVTVSDLSYLVAYLFQNGQPPGPCP